MPEKRTAHTSAVFIYMCMYYMFKFLFLLVLLELTCFHRLENKIVKCFRISYERASLGCCNMKYLHCLNMISDT